MSPILSVAIAYIAHSLPVLPVAITDTGKEGHARWRKVPLNTSPIPGQGGSRGASLDPDQVAQWWQDHPRAQLGIATGHALPGGGFLLVVDDDGQLKAAEELLGALPPSVRISTPGGGAHVYLRTPSPIGNGKGALKAIAGLDVRGLGGYVVAPPSVRPDGAAWGGLIRPERIEWLPETWLHGLAGKPAQEPRAPFTPPPRTSGVGRERAYAEGALRGACERIRAAVVGGRHAQVLAESRTVGGWLHAGLVEADVERQLAEAATCPDYPDGDVRTVRDGLRAGKTAPLSLPDDPPRRQDPGPDEREPDPQRRAPDPLSEARALMTKALGVLYAEQTTKAERQAVARELAGSVDLLAVVAEAAPAEWATWCAGVEAAGGMGEHLRGLRRAVTAQLDEGKQDARRARQERNGQAAGAARAALMARLSTTEDGSVKASYANIVTILRGDPRYSTLRCSSLGDVVEVGGEELNEGPGTADLCEWLRDAYGMDAGEVTAKTALYAVAQGRVYSPVRDYLESVRGKGRDDVVGDLLRDCLGLESPTPMQGAMLGRFLISAVARALDPGCKVDTALILVGEQGAKKSTFFAGLFGDWFGDSPIPIGNKDAPITMSRVWGYEAAELEDLTKKRSVESVKQFMGSSRDLYRPPFARTAILAPRHTVLCGSVNPIGGKGGSAGFLSDPSGSRRFWIISVPPDWLVPLPLVASLRDRAWAWALAEYEAGERWWFDRAEDIAREEDAQQYQIEDPWHESVGDWLTQGAALSENFTTGAVLAGIGLDINQRGQREASRVRAILVRLGWIEKASPAGFRGQRVWRRS